MILVSAQLCFAQENIRFERISVNEGLSQADVKSMVQDRFGFLWIGTRDGLNKYDGYEFTRYTWDENDATSLHFNQILDLQVDSAGNVWVGSAGGLSVYHYRKNVFANFFPADRTLKDVEVNHILLTGNNTALLSTTKGLITFDRQRKSFFVAPQFVLFRGMRVFHSQKNESLGLWVGTDSGVFIKANDQSAWTRLLEDTHILHIAFDVNRKVYLSTSRGLFAYDVEKKNLEQINTPPGPVMRVLRVKNGDLWVASNKVIVLDKDDRLKYVLSHDKLNNHSLSEDRARVLFQTRDEVIWVGTFGYGLNKFNPDVAEFSFLSKETSLPLSTNYVSAVFTADDATVLVGTSHGLDVINLSTRSAIRFSDNEELFQIFKIFADRKSAIWVATSKGFMLYSNNQLVSKNNSLRSVVDIDEWDGSHLILATRVDGVYLFNRNTERISPLISANNLPEEVSCLRVEGNHFWIGSRDGLKLYSRTGQLMRHFNADNQLPGSLHSSFVKSLARDSRGNLWVGTWGGGLSMLNTKDSTFITYTTTHGLPNNVIYGILEDSTRTLWLSTNLGISAFHPEKRLFRNFDFLDGLQSNEFNTGAYFQSANGTLYFGGVNGLNFFQPGKVLKHHPLPSIITTSITVNNKALPFAKDDSFRNVLMVDRIQSNWKNNDIGLTFTAVDFKHAQKFNFQYSVKDTTWYTIGNRRSLELIDLPSGHHEIKVRAQKPRSDWSEDVVLLTIDIVPPVWERMWFRMLAFFILVALIYAAARYRVVRLRQANAALNRLVAERTKEIVARNEEIASQNDLLNDLNKELEAFSYSVSHDLRTPLRSVIGFSKMLEEDFNEKLDKEGKRVLSVIRQNAIQMNRLIDDLLEFSKTGRKELQKSEVNAERLLQNILEDMRAITPKKTEIRAEALPAVYADEKLLYQVWVNLISNAIKYSSKNEAPVIEIGAYDREDEHVFYVKDNGAGFDMQYVDKLFGVFQRLHKTEEFEGTGVGLALVQRIVVRHGGRVWAEGKLGEGATFYFSLPKDK